MATIKDAAGRAVVLQPGDGPSYWQPMPANGFSEIKLTPENTGYGALSSGFQTIAAGGHIRAHSHDEQIEMLVFFRGRGRVVVDGESHPCEPGTTFFLGPHVRHQIINDSDADLVMLWMISPPGLEDFFATIGRPRSPGSPAPAPFARPDDVTKVEHRMGFRDIGD
ncbi:MAG: cupin domain-containing protein [Alphaproteobacteria bacterium]|nr:cupin domain-containing protein [Alphaproteobacteria bacterium]MDP6516675.1 cupin domain-containing protein [Alphaproteobacteria bacterium]|tara:strand:- start:343 stop:840 length:498 start_codon:yes stop_codon:yes gene_type:complete